MSKFFKFYFLFLYTAGGFIYITLIATEFFIGTKEQAGIMTILYFVRYFFYGSVKGGNMAGNQKSWQTVGLAILDIIFPPLFIYFLFI